MNEIVRIELEDLGFDDFFNSALSDSGLTDYTLCRVIAGYKETYRVKGLDGEFQAKITGKQMYLAATSEDYPAVGDWVAVTITDNENAVIHKILPRKTILKRKHSGRQEAQVIAANLDTAFIVQSMDRDYSLNRFERYLVMAEEESIDSAVILNKIDLITPAELQQRIDQIKKRFTDIDIITTSTITADGLCDLENYIAKGKTYCFLGSSGVGKSTLINKLLNRNEIKTSEISQSTGKGRHTTTSREMYFLSNGGIVIDNPGTREVGITDASIGIESVFDEITRLAENCKFADCTHTREPGCAVLLAIENNELDEEKYQNYLKLNKEAHYYEMNDLEKREKDRQFGKFIKKAKEQVKGYKR